MAKKARTKQSSAEPSSALTKDGVTQLTKLCRQQVRIERRIEQLNQQLKDAKEELKEVQENKIPALMTEMDITELKLGDRSKVQLEDYLSCKATSEGLQWLEQNDHASIIKDTVTVEFDKGEHDQATRLFEQLQKKNLPVSETIGVHPSTLKATLKKLIKSGVDVPHEKFNLFQGLKAKITLPKAG